MPRPVVPIFLLAAPLLAGTLERAVRRQDQRRIVGESQHFAARSSSPFSRIVSISATSAQGSTTTPLPMIDSLSGTHDP